MIEVCNAKMKIKQFLYKNRNIVKLIIAIFVTIGLSISLDIVDMHNIKGVKGATKFEKIFIQMNNSIEKDTFKSICIFGLTYFLLRKNYKNKNSIYKVILAIFFAIFTILGYSYDNTNTWDLIFKSKIQFFKASLAGISYYIVFKLIINYVSEYLIAKIKYTESKNKLFNYIFEKKSFLMPLLIILVCWLPYLIFIYPGILTVDAGNQIMQFFGLDIAENTATNSTNLIDENVKITNHHPVIHTLILGSAVKLGKIIGNDNLGIFIYTIIQTVFLACSLAYIINFMKKIKTNKYIRIISLIAFSLVPIFPIYAVEITKDVPFTSILIFYMIELYEILKSEEKITKRKVFLIMITSLLVCLLRNNGIYTILLSLPFVAIVNKKNRKTILLMVLGIFIIYESFIKIALPTLKISNGGVQEMLSIPFQQTARYVKEYDGDVTEEEKLIIDKVLDYETLGKRYVPNRSDAVKGKYNKDASKDDLKNYFGVWFKQFFRHPNVYVEAFLNNYYGYFCIESNTIGYVSGNIVENNKEINETGEFDYNYIESFVNQRKIINRFVRICDKIPVINWVTNIGLNTWGLLFIFMYLLYKKKYKFIIYLLPSFTILLVCIASPVNVYFRYAMPNIFAMPLILSIFFDIIRCEKEEEYK